MSARVASLLNCIVNLLLCVQFYGYFNIFAEDTVRNTEDLRAEYYFSLYNSRLHMKHRGPIMLCASFLVTSHTTLFYWPAKS